jgi:hypothetical protein
MDRLEHHPQDRLRMRFPDTLTDLKKVIVILVMKEIDRFEICRKMKVMNHLFETDQRKTMNDLSEIGRKNQGTGCHYLLIVPISISLIIIACCKRNPVHTKSRRYYV